MVVILIWGGVAFRFIDSFGSKNKRIHHNETVEELNLTKFEVDSFELHSKYRDTFFGKVYSKTKKTPRSSVSKKTTTKVQTTIKETVPKTTEPFPSYIYHGSVNLSNNTKKVHMIEVEGQSYQVTAPRNIGRIEVTRVFNDSLEIKFNNEIKIIHP